MTAVAPPRQPASRPTSGRAGRQRNDGVHRTLLSLLAAGLGVVPLKALFSDNGWLIDVWLTMVVVLGPALLLRRRRAPSALDIWPGIVLMVPWLTLLFVRSHAIAGVIPGPATWHDVSLLLTNLHHTTRDEVAPIHTTVAVRLVVCALLGLVAALIDLVAVVGHRGALAGIPLLVIYTVAGAVPRQPVSWVWFAFAAVGFLLLLGVDAPDMFATWGQRIRPPKASRGTNAVSVTTPRIAAAAVVVAIVLPLLVPAQSRNLISNAFHGGGSSGGSGIGGFGGGAEGSISPFAELKGELVRPTAVNLATVRMLGSNPTEPFYLRVNVLADYTGQSWQAADHGQTVPISSNGYPEGHTSTGDPYPTEPEHLGNAVQLKARIALDSVVRGNPPVFAVPTSVTGLDGSATWSAQDQLVLGQQLTGATTYDETFDQVDPSAAELNAAGDSVSDPQVTPYLELPKLPTYVSQRVAEIDRGQSTLYEKARAINDYFTNPKYGFTYSLQTKVGDSGSELVDFLKNKQGFCQQYAAAEAVMFRASGIPSRVVLGYMHTATGQDDSFTVTTTDAHAWVEAYFPGEGWVPFDPTPSAGLAGGSQTDLPWARHADLPASTGSAGQQGPSRSPSSAPSGQKSSATPSSSKHAVASGSGRTPPTSLTPLWWGLGVVAIVLLALVPAGTRRWRRRARLASVRRTGDAAALWAEFSDSVVDLGYPWSTARTPRQVARWLTRDAPDASAWLAGLADAVEQDRYARPGAGQADASSLIAGLRSALLALRSRRTRTSRLRAALWPASLGWGRAGLADTAWFGRHRD